MELSFGSKKLRSECLEPELAERAYGSQVAAALRAVVADLDAAPALSDLPPSELTTSADGVLSFDLSEGWVLRGEPGGGQAGLGEANRIYRIKLVRIEER